MASYGFPDAKSSENRDHKSQAKPQAQSLAKEGDRPAGVGRKGPVVKLLIVGDSGSGKSSLLLRFCDDQHIPNYISTIGLDFKVKPVEIEGQNVRLQLWDAAGQERFRSIVAAYYRGAHGIALVFDLTDPLSFQSVRNWMKQIEAHSNTSKPSIVLIGNKSDLARQVSMEEAKALSDEFAIPYFETSAKTGDNVNGAIKHLATLALNEKEGQRCSPKRGSCDLKQTTTNKNNNKNRSCADNPCDRF